MTGVQTCALQMSLSEDGLTYGNTATNGYPAIIGTLPFDSSLYAFEVIPTSLDCKGKEGFGIISKDDYLNAYESDKATPTVYNSMIGLMYRQEAKNMDVKEIRDMEMGSKYYVRVNIPELYVTIEGPGTKLKAELKSGIVYYPCFSCGCSNNKLKIRPLEYFEEGMEL